MGGWGEYVDRGGDIRVGVLKDVERREGSRGWGESLGGRGLEVGTCSYS